MSSYVTCLLYGQLGNQLYQVATTLAYAWDYGAIPVFPELHKETDGISFNRDRIFFRCDSSMPPRPFKQMFQEKAYHSAERVPFAEDLVLNGHFQSWKHFDHHRDEILKVFAPSEEILAKLQAKYADVLSIPNVVGVHVRTHSKHLHENGLHVFTGFQFYRDAMNLFPNATFAVFCDRIAWCKRVMPQEVGDKKMIFIEGNDWVEDLFLFSMMQHQILGNSTYAWWGAYLNQKANAKILAARDWRDPVKFPGFPTQDFFPPNWTLVAVGFDHPWPEGMEREVTTSVNN